MIFKNFAITTVAVAPSPSTTGTSLTVATSAGVLFPDTPFNATIWPIGEVPLVDNAEIVTVTNITGDVFTVTRQQESTNVRSVIVGDQIAATITAKTAHNIKNMNTVITSAANYVPNEWDDAVVCNRLTDMTVDIPMATGSGRSIIVKNIEDILVQVRPSGMELIDGENVNVNVYQWESIIVMDYDVGKWIII
jgi:hypothetical protein